MSSSYIPAKTKELLFGQAAGRCEYRGCNKLVTEDHHTGKQGKFSVFAHIVADSPDGPRGDEVRSPLLARAIENLMLLCFDHHRLIDDEDEDGHPEALLLEMKRDHEDRVQWLTEINGEHRTLVLTMGTAIGTRMGLPTDAEVLPACLPRYPLRRPVSINLTETRILDGTAVMWAQGGTEIIHAAREVQERLRRDRLDHVSVFAIAPMPLLMLLGRHLGDLQHVDAKPKRREPPGWGWWPSDVLDVDFGHRCHDEGRTGSEVLLVLSVSDDVDLDLARTAGSPGALLYELRVDRKPMTDIVRSAAEARRFMRRVREVLTEIRASHGAQITIRVLPAVPNCLAVAFGQALLPKTDPRMVVHDLNRDAGGWAEVLVLLDDLTA